MVARQLVFLLLLGTTVCAQLTPLTLEDAQRRAAEASRLLKASNHRVIQAEARASEVAAGRLPSLRVAGSYTRLNDVGPWQFDNPLVAGQKIILAPPILDNYQVSLNASQVLFAGFRLDAAKDAADFSTDAARFEFLSDQQNLTYNTTVAYWTLYKAQQLQQSVTQSVKQLEARVRDAENMYKAGMITSNDVLKLKVQASNVNVQLLDVKQQVSSMMVAFNNLLGLDLSAQLELTSLPRLGGSENSFSPTDVQYARDNRPDVKAGLSRVRAAERSIDAAYAGFWPQVSASALYLYANPNQRIFPIRARFDGTWAVALNVSWDLWNWLTPQHQAMQARAQMLQVAEGVEVMRDQIAVESMQNYQQLQPARERIDVANQALAQASENGSITTNRYNAGTATSTEVIEAETLLLQARVNAITASVDYELSLARLRHSLGK